MVKDSEDKEGWLSKLGSDNLLESLKPESGRVNFKVWKPKFGRESRSSKGDG